MKKLSIIMPVYNERDTVESVIDMVLDAPLTLEKELVVVDDGSTDGTRDVLESLDRSSVKVVLQERNQGKGAAIRRGLPEATGDIVIIQDADKEYDPKDYQKLVDPIISGEASVVYGSRQLGDNEFSYRSFYLGGLLLSWLTNLLYGSKITDEPTCYKVFRKDVIDSIELKCLRFEFCPEVTAKVLKKGIKIVERPIAYYPRSIDEGKKIRWQDGVEAILTLLRYRFFN
jgi:glycosyltransferase involved in cell wall biosynthesis